MSLWHVSSLLTSFVWSRAAGGQDYDQDDWPGTNQGAKGRLPAAAAAAPAQQPAAAEPAPPPQLARASSGSGTQGLASTDLEVLKEAAEGYADEEADKARAQGEGRVRCAVAAACE